MLNPTDHVKDVAAAAPPQHLRIVATSELDGRHLRYTLRHHRVEWRQLLGCAIKIAERPEVRRLPDAHVRSLIGRNGRIVAGTRG